MYRWINFGQVQRACKRLQDPRPQNRMAALTWLATNGINVLAGHSFEDPDTDVAFDEAQRIHAGVQITPYTGITVDVRYRVLFPRTGGLGADDDEESTGSDLFLQLHLWN